MIVDVHYHLFPFDVAQEPHLMDVLLEELMRVAKIIGLDIKKEDLRKKGPELWTDLHGKNVIKIMNEAGIDVTAVCYVDVDDGELTYELAQSSNEAVSNIAKNHPDRLISFAGVDPRRPEALEMLTQCFEEFNMHGLKYHPDYGFDPSGPESYRLLEYLEKKNGILLTHTGPFTRARSKYTEPMLLSDILADFPSLKIIAAHIGQINWRPWAALAALNPNLYGDLSMWAPFAIGRFDLFCRELRDIIDYVGVEKILFGSDSPVYDLVLPVKDFIEKIQKLPEEAPKGITFTQDEIDAILGENAARILDLH
jgi:predicted TIM-barrel fold metal-dependent hydrolase